MKHIQKKGSLDKASLLACLFSLVACVPAFAHDPGLSSANLEIGARAFTLQLTFNERDIAGVLASSAEENLEAVARRASALRVEDKPLAPDSVTHRADNDQNIEFRYTFPRPEGATEIIFQSALLQELPFGHRQAFAAIDARGNEIARRLLSARENEVSVPLAGLPAQSRGGRFLEFFRLGLHHIVTGYDHLLFLFGLLIVCRNLRSAVVLITCFTLAHSFTLALATFDLVHLPSRLVESVIAASILYVGVENLVRGSGLLQGRWLLTLVFGLVHGLGFAGVLHEMGIAKTGSAAALPLLAFNLGVELGQLAIAAVVLPIIWKLRAQPMFLRVGVPACSLFVVAAGAYWLIERTVLS